jgi:outer membrane protein
MMPGRGRCPFFAAALLLSTGCASMSSSERYLRDEPDLVASEFSAAGRPSSATRSAPGPDPASPDGSLTRTGMASTDSRSKPFAGPSGALGLEEAKSLAIRLNPQVAQDREAMAKAEGGEEVAFSGYLPTVLGSYSYQGFSSDVGFAGTHDRFPVLPVRGFGPGTQDFSVTEAQLRWNVFQFGRQVAKHGQSVLRVEIARLQYQRSIQAAEYDVSQSYFRVLESRAALVNAEQAVIRAEAILEDARDLLKQGVINPEDVLRAEVESAEVRQLLTTARSTAEVSVAGLNRSIGLEINAPTEVVERREEPTVEASLEDCLALAVARRPEIAVVRKGIAIADAEIKVARSQFLPTFSIQSSLSNITGKAVQNANVLGGGAFATLELYAGGKRKGQLHIATAEARASIAQAKAVCDGIAYETNVAYRGIEDARERIAQSRTALSQARESFRLTGNRLRTGDAIPSELVAAQTSLTRAEQSYNAAFYDYQAAIARLEFAVGGPVARPGAEVAPPGGTGDSIPLPPPSSGRSPFKPEGAPRLPSIIPRTGLEPIPSPFDEGGRFAPPRPGGLTPAPSPGPTSPSAPSAPGLARPPYQSNPLTPPGP